MNFKDFNHFLDATKPPTSVMSRLEALKGLKERSDFHPEANTFEHIKIVTERLILTNDIDLIFSGVLHDLFKHDTACINPKNGFITCPGHDIDVADFIQSNKEVNEWIKSFGADPEVVMNLCKDHMRFKQFEEMRDSKKKEFQSRPHWKKLVVLGAADDMLKDFKI